MILNSLGIVLRTRGDVDGAAAAYERALPILTAMNGGDPPEGVLHNLAYVELARNDARAAAEMFIRSAERYRTTGGDQRGLAECVIGLGTCAVRRRRPDLATRLFAAADAELERLGTAITPTNSADYESTRA